MAECTPMLRAVLTAVLCLLALGILLCLIRGYPRAQVYGPGDSPQ